jgi:DNA transposition AAA+ family ATPase
MSGGTPPIWSQHLAQEARVTYGRILPKDGALSQTQIQQVRADTRAYLEQRGKPITWLARQAGKKLAPSTLSEFLSGSYAGDNDEVARTLNALLDNLIAADRAKVPQEWVELGAAKRMMRAIRKAYTDEAFSLIIGDSGYGKTLTMKAAHAMYPGSIYVRVDLDTSEPSALLHAIVSQAVRNPPSKGFAKMWRVLLESLRDSKRLILIDEGHLLTSRGRQLLRDILDQSSAGIVITITDDTLKRLRNESGQRTGQFLSRVVDYCDLDSEAADGAVGDGQRLFSPEEVTTLFSQAKLRLTGDGPEFVASIVAIPGSGALRMVSQLIRNITSIKQLAGKDITSSEVLAVLRRTSPLFYVRAKELRAADAQGGKRRAIA